MKTNWLFPHRYRLIGWIIFIPAFVLGMFCLYGEFRFNFLEIKREGLFNNINFTDEIASIGIIVGLLFIAFAREKIEDEMIQQVRLESLQWSVYVNYLILGLAIIFVHGGKFVPVMIYNMFTILLVFIIRFRVLLYKNTRELEREVTV